MLLERTLRRKLENALTLYQGDRDYEALTLSNYKWILFSTTELTYSPPILHSGYRGTPRSPRAAFLARPALREGSACTFLPVRSATRSERALACSTVRFSFTT